MQVSDFRFVCRNVEVVYGVRVLRELSEVLFADDRAVHEVQDFALAPVLDAPFGRQVEVLVELVPLLVFDVRVEPLVEVLGASFPHLLGAPNAADSLVQVLDPLLDGRRFERGLLDLSLCECLECLCEALGAGGVEDRLQELYVVLV